MKRNLLVLLTLVLLTASGANAVSTDNESPETWKTVLDLLIIDQVLGVYFEHGPDFEKPDEWIALDLYAKRIPELFSNRIPTQDGWRNRYIIGYLDSEIIVVSCGPDGNPDATINPSPEHAYDRQFLEDMETDDIILVLGGGGLINAPRTTTMHQRASMADLRSLAIALESYAIDNNAYPGQDRGLTPISAIQSILEPLYIRYLPLKDSWGNDFFYWSDEANYILISPGADGLLDNDYGTRAGEIDNSSFGGGSTDPDRDIVFANGQFVQYPAGAQL